MLPKDSLPVHSGFYYVNGLGLPRNTLYFLKISRTKSFVTIDIKCSVTDVTFAFLEYFDGKPWRGFNGDQRLGKTEIAPITFRPQESLLGNPFTRRAYVRPAIYA